MMANIQRAFAETLDEFRAVKAEVAELRQEVASLLIRVDELSGAATPDAAAEEKATEKPAPRKRSR
jgi:hypothetical protein